jgi:phosphoribosylanthranilate isomerase
VARTWVKICGVRTVEAALLARAEGADAVGLNLYAPSPRSISVEEAAELCAALREAERRDGQPPTETLLVVVNPDEETLARWVDQIGPTSVQLHGELPDGFGAWLGVNQLRAFAARPGVMDTLRARAGRRFLLDAFVSGQHGGTGKTVDLALAQAASELGELVLAGGLTPENVAAALDAVQPFGVDVASGVESSPGQQSLEKIAAFIRACRSHDARRP